MLTKDMIKCNFLDSMLILKNMMEIGNNFSLILSYKEVDLNTEARQKNSHKNTRILF